MGLASSSSGTTSRVIPGIQAGERWKYAGVDRFDSVADLNTAVGLEIQNRSESSPQWRDGMVFTAVGKRGRYIWNGTTGVMTYDPRSQRITGPMGFTFHGKLETNTNPNYTFHESFFVPFQFYAVKVRILNSQATDWPGVNVAMACSSSFTSLVTPTGAWTQIAAAQTVPAATAGGGTDSSTFGIFESDIIPLASIPRSDGDIGSCVMARLHWPTGNGVDGIAQPNPTAPTKTKVSVWRGYQSGNTVTSGQASFTSTTVQFQTPPLEFLFYTASGVRSYFFVGDSIVQGLNDTTGFGWAAQVVNASAGAVVPFIPACAGMTSNAYLANFLNAVSWTRPHLATFCPFSPNDTDKYTAAGEARQLTGMAQFLQACDSYGVVPVLTTPTPLGSLAPTNEASRRRIAAAVRALSDFVTVIDFDTLLADYSTTTGNWLISGDTGDGTHPSTQGYAKMAAFAAPTLLA